MPDSPRPPARLTRRQARRIAVRAQLLDASRPTDLLDTVRRLTLVQYEPTAAIAPSADLVLWSRLGPYYAREDLTRLLESHVLLEMRGMIRPAHDAALYRAEMSAWPGPDAPEWMNGLARWVEANDACRRDILARLRAGGPMISRDLPDTCAVSWASSGWNNGRNVAMMLELMELRGEVAVAGRLGRERRWDLAERLYPDDAVVPEPDASRERRVRRLRALGIARARTTQTPGEPNDVGEVGVAAVVDGVRGQWRVDAAQLDRVSGDRDVDDEGRTALLSPFDRLVFDRKRMLELFEFDYQLGIYTPVARRRFGFYALPVLRGDRLVGKVDASADAPAGVLRVHRVYEDEPFDAPTADAVHTELESLAFLLRLRLVVDG